jgi:hypothetical protein
MDSIGKKLELELVSKLEFETNKKPYIHIFSGLHSKLHFEYIEQIETEIFFELKSEINQMINNG